MSNQVSFVPLGEEGGIPFDELNIDPNSYDVDGELSPVGSDIKHSPAPTTTEPTHRGRAVEMDQGQGLRGSSDFDAFLAEADVEALDELTTGLATGRVKVAAPSTPPRDPIAESIERGSRGKGAFLADLAPEEPRTIATPPAPVSEDPGEDPTDGEDKKRTRVRLVTDDDRAAVDLAKKEGIGLVEAAARILEQKRAAIDDLIEPDPQPQTTKTGTTPVEEGTGSLPFTSVADAEARIYDLEEQADNAQFRDFDDEKALELRREIRSLRRQLPEIAAAEEKQWTEESQRLEADYNARYDAAEARAKAIFPQLHDPQSHMLALMSRLDSEAKEKDPSLFHNPEKFLELALRAAERLSGSSAPTSASTASPAIPPRQPAARGVIASPSARATTPAPAKPRVAEEIDAVMSVDDLEELNLRLGIR